MIRGSVLRSGSVKPIRCHLSAGHYEHKIHSAFFDVRCFLGSTRHGEFVRWEGVTGLVLLSSFFLHKNWWPLERSVFLECFERSIDCLSMIQHVELLVISSGPLRLRMKPVIFAARRRFDRLHDLVPDNRTGAPPTRIDAFIAGPTSGNPGSINIAVIFGMSTRTDCLFERS